MSAVGVNEALQSLLPEHRVYEAALTPHAAGALPAAPAVALLCDGDGRPVLLSRTQNLRRAVVARLIEAPANTAAKRADLASVVRRIRWVPVHSAFEARWRYLLAARVLYPREYRRRLDFGPAWYLCLDPTVAIPQIVVSERIWQAAGELVGPWVSRRECLAALDGVRDLFDLCRYPEQIARTPHGQRCAYADMGRCDAPCDGSTPPGAYLGRTRAAWSFVRDGTGSWIAAAADRMRAAARAQRFELAGQIKQQLAFAERWRAECEPRIHGAAAANFVLVVPAVRRKALKPFVLRAGHLEGGPLVRTATAGAEVESWLRTVLAEAPAACVAPLRMEQSWLVARFCASDAATKAIIVRFGGDEPVGRVSAAVRARVEAPASPARRGPRDSASEAGDES